MEHYKNALSHLHSAMDEMVQEMDTLVVANIAYPIQLVEIALLNARTAIINEKFDNVRE